MRALLHGDQFPRLLQDMRRLPGKWARRGIFLLGPWVCLWMVEILNENDLFEDLYAWQVLMNMVWYYILFGVCRLILGRCRRAAAAGAVLSFLVGLLPLHPALPGAHPLSRRRDRLAHRRQRGRRL